MQEKLNKQRRKRNFYTGLLNTKKKGQMRKAKKEGFFGLVLCGS